MFSNKKFLFVESILFILLVVFALKIGVQETFADWVVRTDAGLRSWNNIASSSDGSKIVATTNNYYIYTSSDYGVTWTEQVDSGQRGWSGITSSSDGTKLAAVVYGGYVYTSVDSGATWTERISSSFQNWTDVTSSADGSYIVATTANSEIYVSNDYGENWSNNAWVFGGPISWASITSSSNGRYLAAVGNSNDIYTSSDYGSTWNYFNIGFNDAVDVESSSDGSILYVVPGLGYIHKSGDFGQNWTVLESSSYKNWNAISSSADGVSGVAIANGEYMYSTVDSGSNWVTEVDAGINNWTDVTTSSDGSRNAATTQGDYIYTNYIVPPDVIAPTISSVTSNKQNGAYAVGESIDIIVTFSEAVTSSGGVNITLETGGTDQSCGFSITNSDTGTCNYTVEAGDTSSDLTVFEISGAIEDQSGNAVSDYAIGTNLAASKAIIIDTTAPSTSVTAPVEGATISGDSVSVTASASDTNIAGVQFKLNTNTSIGSEDTSDPFSANLDTTLLSNGDYTLISVARDLAGNYATSTAISVTVDNTEEDVASPVVSSPSPSGVQVEGTTGVTLQVTTNESATCRYGTISDTTYASISNTFSTTGGVTHTQAITGLSANTSYSYYVRCSDGSSNVNSSDTEISFSIPADTEDEEEEEIVVENDTPRKKGSVIQIVSNTFTSTVSRSVNRISDLFSDLTKTLQDEPKNENKIEGIIEKLKLEFIKLLESGEAGITHLNQNPSQTFTMNLELGDSNEEVRLLQVFLNNNGYIVAETGPGSIGNETMMFGYATQASLVRFQKDNNIIPSVGYFGPITRNLINNLN